MRAIVCHVGLLPSMGQMGALSRNKPRFDARKLRQLRCPASGERLLLLAGELASESGRYRYKISSAGIPCFAPSGSYTSKPTERDLDGAYRDVLDRAVLERIGDEPIGGALVLGCRDSRGLELAAEQAQTLVGAGESEAALAGAGKSLTREVMLIQVDATKLPLCDDQFDLVLILDAIAGAPNRIELFREVYRVLKPGGRFIWREPAGDFAPWRLLRPGARGLLEGEVTIDLGMVGLRLETWQTVGFVGTTLLGGENLLGIGRFMNRLPGMRRARKLVERADRFGLNLPGLSKAGLRVIGSARSPAELPDSVRYGRQRI